MAGRITKAEKERRVSKVFELIVGGFTTAQIRQYAAREWGVSRRQAARYVAEATQRVAERAATHHDVEFGKALEQQAWLWREAVRLEKLGLALAVRRETNKLCGLYAPTLHEIRAQPSEFAPYADMGDEELDAHIKRLEATLLEKGLAGIVGPLTEQ